MKKNYSLGDRGFTLIELLVVISIIFTVSVAGVMSFRNYNNSQILETGVLTLESVLNTARIRAVSRVLPDNNPTCLFQGYEVKLTSSGSYETDALCGTTEVRIGSQTGTLPGELELSGDIAAPIVFHVGDGTTNARTISITNDIKIKTISLDSTGNVTIKEIIPTATPIP